MHNVDIRNVSLGQIMYFVKVAEMGNITKSADFFNLSQPTLSKKLKSLESQLDLQLFYRGGHEIVLTPAGRYLYEKWKNRIDNIEDDIQHAHILQLGQDKSIVAGGMDSHKPDAFLLPIVESFEENYPQVNVRIESDSAQELRRMLIENEVDVIFSVLYDFESKELADVEWIELGETTHCACMKKTNPLAQKTSLTVKDLKCQEFVCISPRYLPEYITMINKMCREAGFAPNIRNYVSSANSLTLNIREDNEVFICDKYYADLNHGENVIVPIENTKSCFVVAWKKNNSKACLSDFIEEARLLFS